MLMKRQLFLAGISLMLGGMPMLAQDISPVNSVSYEWKSVPIVGGGFVEMSARHILGLEKVPRVRLFAD